MIIHRTKILSFLLIIATLLIGCNNKAAKERIQFAQLLLDNLDSASYIVQASEYYCDQKDVFIKEYRDSIKQHRYKYYKDDVIMWKSYSFNYRNKSVDLARIDTIHIIVFRNIKEKGYVSFEYFLKNNRWCYEIAYLGNVLEEEEHPSYD
ncbi:MAG: hypothetical protein ACM3U1_08215 [Chloroflexota bacterium]